jgi:hypothetical protein
MFISSSPKVSEESCWFTEEIGTSMRCWESPGDLPLVIEIVVSFRLFRCAPLAKRHKISITHGRSPGLSQERMQEPIILCPFSFWPLHCWCFSDLQLLIIFQFSSLKLLGYLK